MTEIKHFSRRLLCILLAVCMAAAFVPLQTEITASAVGSEEIVLNEGVDSAGSGWTFNGSNNTLTLENADLYYSGSSSLFSFDCSYAGIVLKGYNSIELGNAGASAFELSMRDLGIIESSGMLEIKGNGVYLAEKETFITVDSGFILTPGIKAAGGAVTTINGGYLEADSLSETGTILLVNGGYVYAGASYGDVTVKGGFVHEWDAFMGGSLTFQNCVIQTANIDFNCTVEQKANDSVLILEEDRNNWSNKSPGILQGVKKSNTSRNWKGYSKEYYGSAKQISDGEHSGVFVDSGSGGSSEIDSGVTLSGGNYFFNDNADQPALIIKPGAKLADGINNATIVGRNNNGTAIELDGTDTTNTGNFKFGTLTGLGKDYGIRIKGSARLTGGRICGKAENGNAGGAGVDISIENGGSISGNTQLIGISQGGTGAEINSCPSADSSTSIIGCDRGDGRGLVMKSPDSLDCGLTSCGKYGLDTDITYNTTFYFDMSRGSTTPFGETFDYSNNCSGKGWEFYRNNYGEYEKYLPYQQPGMAATSLPALLVLDNFSFNTLADEAVSIPAANYSINDVYIIVKGNCSLTGAKYGLLNSAANSITLIGADEDSKLTINVTGSESNGAGIYQITPRGLTIKNLNLSINAGSGCGISSSEALSIYNSDITISQDDGSDYAINVTSATNGSLCFGGSNNFTFYGSGKVGNHLGIYSCKFAESSQAAADYNEKIQSGETISEMVFNNGEKVSTVGFDFNTEKYNVSEITSEFDYQTFQTNYYVTLTDKDPNSAKRYGGEPLEIDLSDFFVGGNGMWNNRTRSTYTPEFTGDSFDIDRSTSLYTGTASNSDNTVTIGFRYDNIISSGDVNVISSLPDDRSYYILYKFDVEMQPVISTSFNEEGGNVIVSAEKVKKGEDATVTVTPKNGWVVGPVKLNGEDVELTDGKLYLTNITEHQQIDVEFKRVYTVTVNVEGIDNSALSVVSPVTSTYIEGENAVFKIADLEGYVVTAILDGKPVELTDGQYMISNIDSDHTLLVTYSKKYATYSLTIECGPNGKTSLPANTTFIPNVESGTLYDIELFPDEGYEVKAVTVNGRELTVINNKVSFTLTADTVLKIEFKKKPSDVPNPSVPTGGFSGKIEPKPSLNGSSMSWNDISAELDKMAEGSVVIISMNGTTSVPADVIRSIMNKKLKAEFIVDNVKSWIIDGANVSSAASADLRIFNRASNTGKLRGTCAINVMVNKSGVPAALRLKLDKKYADKFANIYKLSNGKLEYCSSIKISTDGSVDIIGAESGGEYVVMACEFSDITGDVNNDGIVNALDASAVLRHIVDIEDAENPLVGDFNGDGIVNAMDAHEILKTLINA